MKVVDRWETPRGSYLEIKIGNSEACCAKRIYPSGAVYILSCHNGMEVYSYPGGADFPLRELSDKEYGKIVEYAKKQF